MRPVNLIPPEERRGERAPLRKGAAAYVLVAVLVVAFGTVYVLVSTGNTIKEREAEVAVLEHQLGSAEARAEALQAFAAFAATEEARSQTVSDLARSRFDWERVLRELALVIPSSVSMNAVSGSVTGSTASGSAASGDSADSGSAVTAPTLQLSGCAASQNSVALLVAALRDIDGVTRVGLTSSSERVEGGSAGSSGGSTGSVSGTCAPPEEFTFEVTVAFDQVAVDPATGGITPPAPAEAPGITEAKAARDSVDSAEGRSREVVDRYIPGA